MLIEVPTFDIEVDCPTHSFIANNAIVHNSNCTTRLVTGHGVPQISALADIVDWRWHHNQKTGRYIGIVADGGMRQIGDIAKCLGVGADYVMLGSMFAGSPETPGNIIEKDGRKYKEYRGMASFTAQEAIGKNRTPEGVSRLVPLGSSISEKMAEIKGGLQSALSYTGARNLIQFRDKVQFVRMTHAGFQESTAHGLTTKYPNQ